MFGFKGRLDVYIYVWNHLSPSGNNKLCEVSGLLGMVGLCGVVGLLWLVRLLGLLGLLGGVVGLLGVAESTGTSGVLATSVGAVGYCSSRKGCMGKVGIFAPLRKATIL